MSRLFSYKAALLAVSSTFLLSTAYAEKWSSLDVIKSAPSGLWVKTKNIINGQPVIDSNPEVMCADQKQIKKALDGFLMVNRNGKEAELCPNTIIKTNTLSQGVAVLQCPSIEFLGKKIPADDLVLDINRINANTWTMALSGKDKKVKIKVTLQHQANACGAS